jgi:hypothetical protein
MLEMHGHRQVGCWVQLLAPQPQVWGVKAQKPKGLPGMSQSMA